MAEKKLHPLDPAPAPPVSEALASWLDLDNRGTPDTPGDPDDPTDAVVSGADLLNGTGQNHLRHISGAVDVSNLKDQPAPDLTGNFPDELKQQDIKFNYLQTQIGSQNEKMSYGGKITQYGSPDQDGFVTAGLAYDGLTNKLWALNPLLTGANESRRHVVARGKDDSLNIILGRKLYVYKLNASGNGYDAPKEHVLSRVKNLGAYLDKVVGEDNIKSVDVKLSDFYRAEDAQAKGLDKVGLNIFESTQNKIEEYERQKAEAKQKFDPSKRPQFSDFLPDAEFKSPDSRDQSMVEAFNKYVLKQQGYNKHAEPSAAEHQQMLAIANQINIDYNSGHNGKNRIVTLKNTDLKPEEVRVFIKAVVAHQQRLNKRADIKPKKPLPEESDIDAMVPVAEKRENRLHKRLSKGLGKLAVGAADKAKSAVKRGDKEPKPIPPYKPSRKYRNYDPKGKTADSLARRKQKQDTKRIKLSRGHRTANGGRTGDVTIHWGNRTGTASVSAEKDAQRKRAAKFSLKTGRLVLDTVVEMPTLNEMTELFNKTYDKEAKFKLAKDIAKKRVVGVKIKGAPVNFMDHKDHQERAREKKSSEEDNSDEDK